jgi:hypothetical protein
MLIGGLVRFCCVKKSPNYYRVVQVERVSVVRCFVGDCLSLLKFECGAFAE